MLNKTPGSIDISAAHSLKVDNAGRGTPFFLKYLYSFEVTLRKSIAAKTSSTDYLTVFYLDALTFQFFH